LSPGSNLQAERWRLADRLEHRLQSSLLLLREAASRGDLDGIAQYGGDVSRRARALVACCAVGDAARSTVRDVLAEWMGGLARWSEEEGEVVVVEAPPGHEPPEAAEFGEPLVRLLAAEGGGELMSWSDSRAVLRLPSN